MRLLVVLVVLLAACSGADESVQTVGSEPASGSGSGSATGVEDGSGSGSGGGP